MGRIITKPLSNLRTTRTNIALAFRRVFTNNPPIYVSIAVAVFIIFWIIFNIFERLLFLEPIITFYLPDDAVTGFIITNITAALMGLLVAINVYIIRNSKLKLSKSSLFSGSVISIASSACASCSSIGFLIMSTFGGFGIVAIDLFSNYQIQLRIVAVVILLWALYSAYSRVTKSCFLDNNKISTH